MKNLIYIIIGIFGLPALFIHELSHVIMFILLGKPIKSIEFNITNKEKFFYNACVNSYKCKSLFTTVLTSLSPLLVWIILIILSFFYTFPIYIIIYFVLCFNVMLPSKCDFDNVRCFNDKEKSFDRSFEEYLSKYGTA